MDPQKPIGRFLDVEAMVIFISQRHLAQSKDAAMMVALLTEAVYCEHILPMLEIGVVEALLNVRARGQGLGARG